MIHELIVTSAPRGLQPGRSGFTTVLQTRGIHPELARRLEAASAYRHVFPQGDPRNPVIRAHIVVQGPAGTASVLSRIVDAGNGYDGRSNKLAHHVALDAAEVATRAHSSPAAALLALERTDAYMRVWQGEPREQPAGPFLPPASVNPGPCGLWLRAAGDAGWAGFIADRALRREPTWIIAPAGVDLVELFAEALALIPGPQRWGVTFTSYALSAGDALWMGTVEGSPEAEAARGQSRIAVVDLVRPASLTSSSPLIAVARGIAPVPWKRDGSGALTVGTTDPAGLAATNGSRPPPVSGRPPALGAGGGQTVAVRDGAEAFADAEAAAARRSRWATAAIVFGAIAIVAATVAIVVKNWDVVKGWVSQLRLHGDADVPATPVGKTNSSPGKNVESTPPTQAPAEPPAQQIGFADLAKSAAERARNLADEVSAKKKAVEPHLAKAKERCGQLEGLADEAEQAVAAGGSPQSTVERFATAKIEFERAVTQADVITKEARQAAADAKAAAKEATDQEEHARNTCKAAKANLDQCCNEEPSGSPKIPPIEAGYKAALKVLQDAEAARNDAKTWATKASEDTGALDSSDQDLLSVRSRVAAAEHRIKKSIGAIDAAKKAFNALQARLEKADHLPREGLDVTVADSQPTVLCEVGEARVALRLPTELVTTGTGEIWTLACESGSVAASRDMHELIAKPSGPGDPVPLGNAWIDEQRLLRVKLVPRTKRNKDLQDAIASSVLQLSDPADPDATTYVQLCRPLAKPPLEWKRFLDGTGSGVQKTYHPACPIDARLPCDIWPVKVDFAAKCGELVAEILLDVTDPKTLANGAFTGRPVTWAMRWKWKGEPILRTDFVMGNKLDHAEVRVAEAMLEGDWASRARLGYLNEGKEEDAKKFRGLPKVDEFKKQRHEVYAITMQPLVRELLTELRTGREKQIPGLGSANALVEDVSRPKMDSKKPPHALKPEHHDSLDGKPLEEWCEGVRAKLASSRKYKIWATSKYPLGYQPDPEKEPKGYEQWLRNKKIHDAALNAADIYIYEYRDELEARLRSREPEVTSKACEEYCEALLCDWIKRLNEVKEGKAQAEKFLIEALAYVFPVESEQKKKLNEGSPTATFTGEIFVEFPSVDGRCVLLNFKAGGSAASPADGPR